MKKVEGSLETFPDTGCDECNGKIELTLHDKSKGVDVTYRFRLPEDFFQTINTRSQYDSGSNQRGWVDYSHTRPIVAMVAGEQLVFRMNMTINLQKLDDYGPDDIESKYREEFEEFEV